MRKITVLSFITLGGVMQAPGEPEEDTSKGFKYGGWSAPYADEISGKMMEEQIFCQAEKHLRFLPHTGLNMQIIGRVSMMSQNTSYLIL